MKKSLKVLWLIMMVLIISMSSVVFSQGTSEASTTGPLKIGYIGALSGNSATMGEPARLGMVIAFEEMNAKGGINGRPVELIALDDEANPAKSVTQANKLVQQDKVVAAIGGPNSGTALANRQVFFEANIPELVSISTMDDIINPDHPSFKTTFRLSASESYLIKTLANHMLQKGYKKVGIIADTSAYGQTATKTIQKWFAEFGIPISKIVNHEVSASDLTSQILQLKNAGSDAVFIYNLGPDAALTLKTIKQFGWDVPVVGARGLNMQSFIDLAGSFGDGIIIPSDINMNKPAIKEFKEKYDAKYGPTSNYLFSAMGYESAKILFEALRISKGKGGDDLINALEGIKNHPTILGQQDATITFSAKNHEAAQAKWNVLLELKNGEFVIYDEFPFER
ncbi:MAG: ABC transporter substrate-binding protein [Sphaerochaeta sp.]|nr:ABC transporter substrate-binding protein [Sphaerochaeta sp.]